MKNLIKRIAAVTIMFILIFTAVNILFASFYTSRLAKINFNGSILDADTTRHIYLTANSIFFRFYQNRAPDNSIVTFSESFNNKKYIFSFSFYGKIDESPQQDLEIGGRQLELMSFLSVSSKIILNLLFKNKKEVIRHNYNSFLFTGVDTKVTKNEDKKIFYSVCGIGFPSIYVDTDLIQFLKDFSNAQSKSYTFFQNKAATGIMYKDIKSCESIQNTIILSKGGMDFWKGLYLSMVTISTLGYGDFTPNDNLTRLIVGIESVFGLFLFAIFGSAYFNIFYNYFNEQKISLKNDLES